MQSRRADTVDFSHVILTHWRRRLRRWGKYLTIPHCQWRTVCRCRCFRQRGRKKYAFSEIFMYVRFFFSSLVCSTSPNKFMFDTLYACAHAYYTRLAFVFRSDTFWAAETKPTQNIYAIPYLHLIWNVNRINTMATTIVCCALANYEHSVNSSLALILHFNLSWTGEYRSLASASAHIEFMDWFRFFDSHNTAPANVHFNAVASHRRPVNFDMHRALNLLVYRELSKGMAWI